MGCGSSYSPPTNEETTNSQDDMICDMCQTRLNFIVRKKICVECANYFCSSCLPRESGKTRTCSRCKVLVRRPGERTELMKLRVKDLQSYLGRRKINIKSCVEKKDLVELVLQTNDDKAESRRPAPNLPPSRSWEDTTIRVSDQVPLERSNNFPRNYVESSHRREFFEKFGSNAASESAGEEANPDEDMISLENTPIEVLPSSHEEAEEEGEVTLVHRISPSPSDEDDEVIEVTEISGSTSADPPQPQQPVPSPQPQQPVSSPQPQSDIGGAVGGAAIAPGQQEQQHLHIESPVSPAPSSTHQDEKTINEVIEEVQGSAQSLPKTTPLSRLQPDLIQDQVSKSMPSSPRRFANQGVVYLSEIQSEQDLRELSAKQAKEILAMNRVNFKGCVEKEELLKIVERLWRQEVNNKEKVETMEDDSLCKICMDAPIDCVMLECGHMCTCTNCGKQMAECPICRQYVIRVVRTFRA